MPLRTYRFKWERDSWSGYSNTRVVRAEDAKDAITMFEHGQRGSGVPSNYSMAAVAPDACPTCLGFPNENPEECWQCHGTGVMPKKEPVET